LTTKGIDDIASKYMVEAGCMGLRRVTKEDLRKIAKSTGATVVTTFASPEGGETFEPEWLGTAETCYEENVGDNDFIFIKGFKTVKAVSILLRGANEFHLDEIERFLLIIFFFQS
jgi:T-complex protein 1 subunit alpha